MPSMSGGGGSNKKSKKPPKPPKSPKIKKGKLAQNAGGNRTAQELGGTSTDPKGMEVMAGEDERGYIARQKSLQAEAKARMAAKFGNSGAKGQSIGSGTGSSGYPPASETTRAGEEAPALAGLVLTQPPLSRELPAKERRRSTKACRCPTTTAT